jgi:hypothetical protein
MVTPTVNLTHTTVTGEMSRRTILVAMNEAPQTMTANIASKYGKSFEFDMDFPLAKDDEL